MQRRRCGGGLGLGVFLLATELFGIGIPNIPPVTLGFIAFNSAIYLGLLRIVKNVSNACASYHHVFKLGQWKRLFLASFFHLDSMHLYFNMVSFLWKGRTLERRFGKRKFFIIVMVFAVLSQLLMLAMNRVLSTLLFSNSYLTTCAAGFSAVIFGLKVLTTTNMWDESVSVLGLPITVPAQFACWIELVLIQILVPNASFTGHLAGILVGMAFVNGPLHKFVNSIDGFVGYCFDQLPPLRVGERTGTRNRPTYAYRSGATGYRTNYANTQNLDASEQQQIQEAVRRSLQESSSHNRGSSLRSRHNNEPNLPYGWNIPYSGYQESTGFQDENPRQHSYPPANGAQDSNMPPYPVQDDYGMPHPGHYQDGRLYPDLGDAGLGSEVRHDTIRHTNSLPSAPPLERPELYNVD